VSVHNIYKILHNFRATIRHWLHYICKLCVTCKLRIVFLDEGDVKDIIFLK